VREDRSALHDLRNAASDSSTCFVACVCELKT
jgi:hypothetical protein